LGSDALESPRHEFEKGSRWTVATISACVGCAASTENASFHTFVVFALVLRSLGWLVVVMVEAAASYRRGGGGGGGGMLVF
jgi:uncharacterized membrane protein